MEHGQAKIKVKPMMAGVEVGSGLSLKLCWIGGLGDGLALAAEVGICSGSRVKTG